MPPPPSCRARARRSARRGREGASPTACSCLVLHLPWPNEAVEPRQRRMFEKTLGLPLLCVFYLRAALADAEIAPPPLALKNQAGISTLRENNRLLDFASGTRERIVERETVVASRWRSTPTLEPRKTGGPTQRDANRRRWREDHHRGP